MSETIKRARDRMFEARLEIQKVPEWAWKAMGYPGFDSYLLKHLDVGLAGFDYIEALDKLLLEAIDASVSGFGWRPSKSWHDRNSDARRKFEEEVGANDETE